ncbi:MFS transporter [Pseudonocardia phyllosphaerae]|uniref:MFS transporter n=1 Tax=Pseudonocardia phyllosphaerae TaxID=3390502 RepID=UPI0039792A42
MLVLVTLVASVISSFGAPLIPTVARDFHEPPSAAQWTLTVALLVGAVSSPILGRLADGPHRRTTMLGGLTLVTAGGIVAALAGSLTVLITGRALQGVGLGLAPLAIATARDELPQAEVGPAIALLSVSAGAGLGLGYPISGVLADAWGLAGAYWFGAAVSGVALLCVAAVVPSSARRNPGERLDWPGAVLLTSALVPLLVAAAEGTDWGWSSPVIIILSLVGTTLLAMWAVQQLRAENPLVQLRLLRHPSVLAADACALVLGAAMYMVLSAVTQFVQSPRSGGFGFSASAVTAGLVLVPLSMFMLGSSHLLPAVVTRLGGRAVLTLGCLVTSVGCGFFAVFHDALWQAFVMSAVLGVGLGTTFAAIPGVIVQAVPGRETGSAMGFYQVVRFAGFSMGSALTASVLAAHADAAGQPAIDGYILSLGASAGISALAALLAWLLPGWASHTSGI